MRQTCVKCTANGKVLIRMAMRREQSGDAAIPIRDAAAIDPDVKAVLDNLSNGKVMPCAPCAEMNLRWIQDEKRQLERALSTIIKPR